LLFSIYALKSFHGFFLLSTYILKLYVERTFIRKNNTKNRYYYTCIYISRTRAAGEKNVRNKHWKPRNVKSTPSQPIDHSCPIITDKTQLMCSRYNRYIYIIYLTTVWLFKLNQFRTLVRATKMPFNFKLLL